MTAESAPAAIRTGDRIRLHTESELAVGGDALARAADGRVVFVEGAAPDERVLARVYRVNRRFLRAEVEAVLEPSAARTEPRCPHFGTCGGCSLQHVNIDAQRAAKAAWVERGARRLEPEVFVHPLWGGAAWGTRRRARLHRKAGRLGFRARGSHRVVAIDQCPVLTPALSRALPAMQAVGGSAGELRVLAHGEKVYVGAGRRVQVWSADGDGAFRSGPPVVRGEDSWGPWAASPGTFQQASAEGNEAMLAALATRLEALADAQRLRILELYAGSGNFTRVLLRAADTLTAVESHAPAMKLGRSVAGAAHWVADTAEAFLSTGGGGPWDLIFCDPPRAGLSQPVRDAIRRAPPRYLVYVSCDWATCQRDIAEFRRAGFRLASVQGFDLYPHTGHVEVLACLVRASDGDPASSSDSSA